MPTTIEDVLLRRTRVAFLDNAKVKKLVPYIADSMAAFHKWDSKKKAE
jgi:glycerol-3-phosphate dehydrogenase